MFSYGLCVAIFHKFIHFRFFKLISNFSNNLLRKLLSIFLQECDMFLKFIKQKKPLNSSIGSSFLVPLNTHGLITFIIIIRFHTYCRSIHVFGLCIFTSSFTKECSFYRFHSNFHRSTQFKSNIGIITIISNFDQSDHFIEVYLHNIMQIVDEIFARCQLPLLWNSCTSCSEIMNKELYKQINWTWYRYNAFSQFLWPIIKTMFIRWCKMPILNYMSSNTW